MSTLVVAAFAGALAALIVRSGVKLVANRLHSIVALAEYDCAADGSEDSPARPWHAFGEAIADTAASNGRAWLHTSVPRRDRVHTVYGPYTNDSGRPGYIRVKFRIAGSRFQRTNDAVIILDVLQKPYDLQEAQIVLGQKIIRAKDLRSRYRHFALTCYTTGIGVYEYRARVIANAMESPKHRITFDVIRVYRHFPLWEIV